MYQPSSSHIHNSSPCPLILDCFLLIVDVHYLQSKEVICFCWNLPRCGSSLFLPEILMMIIHTAVAICVHANNPVILCSFYLVLLWGYLTCCDVFCINSTAEVLVSHQNLMYTSNHVSVCKNKQTNKQTNHHFCPINCSNKHKLGESNNATV